MKMGFMTMALGGRLRKTLVNNTNSTSSNSLNRALEQLGEESILHIKVISREVLDKSPSPISRIRVMVMNQRKSNKRQ